MKALVTGGGGFLGKVIVRQLLDRGDTVRVLARGDYPELREWGAETMQADIADAEAVGAAVEGRDVVFHCAAKAGAWGSYFSYYEPNVLGTQNVIEACQRRGVRKLVYTSSPSVTFAGKDQEGVDESAPYPEKYLAPYPKTKAMAEQLVLQRDKDKLATVALRPHLIWGPGDTQLIPRLVERARDGKLRIVGDGKNKVDAVYVDNAARAHLLAADLLEPAAHCAYNAYYITNGEPWEMARLVNAILDAAGLPPVTRRISAPAAYAAGAVLEGVYKLRGIDKEPPMTRFVAKQLATAHWYNISAARRDLKYEPEVSMDEGLRRLRESLAAAG